MSKYIFSTFLICFSIVLKAQEKDSIVLPKEKYGIRIGIDLNKLTKTLYDNNYQGLEVVGDYRLTQKYYLAGEIGNENKTVDDDRFNFTTKGTYFKVGFDYNTYTNWLDMSNMVYAGMRYGVSSFNQTINTYKIYQSDNFYGENVVASAQNFEGLNASWLELVGGLKAEIFSNFYAGFSVRLNYLVSNKKPDNFDNLFIPGFNRTYDGKFGVGFNYTLSYMIPIFKKDKKEQETK